MLLTCVVLAAGGPAFGQATVQRLEVHLAFEDAVPHPLIAERLQDAAMGVVERLLLGRPVDQLQALQPRLADTIAGVLDRVATGYVVAGVTAELGVASTITLRLRTVGPVTRDVALRADLGAIHPKVRPLADESLQTRASEIRALVMGLPTAALSWAEPTVASQARQLVETAVPGYTATVRILPGVASVVELRLVVRDSRIIRNIGVRFRSRSIPTLLLDQNAPQVVSIAEPLRGLPVAFAETHRARLGRLINDELVASPPVRQFRVVTSVGLDIAETTYVNVLAESLLYRGRVEAHLNVGTQAPNPAIITHLGRLVAPSTELFVEMRLIPNTLSVHWDLGAQYELSADTAVGLSYTLPAQSTAAWTTVRLSRDVSVRGMWNLPLQAFEGALTYRVNEFLAGEVVGTSRGEFWLRIISNL